VKLPKLGEVFEYSKGPRWIVTSRYPHGIEAEAGFVVLTPIPDGMTPQDLGSKFQAAAVSRGLIEPNEALETWPKGRKWKSKA
jgi:hypothetical protein